MNDLISISKSKRSWTVFTAGHGCCFAASFWLFYHYAYRTSSVLARTARSVPRSEAVNTRSVCLHRQWEWEMCVAFAYILTEIIILLYLAGLELCPVSLVSLKIRLND